MKTPSQDPDMSAEHPNDAAGAEPQSTAQTADDEASGDEFSSVAHSNDPTAELQRQLDQANNRLLRAQAELENYRKRVRREMDEQRRFAQVPIMRDLLQVLDNLERAIEAADQTENNDVASLLQGVHLVTSQLKSALERHNCHRIEAQEGSAFDPNCHEAISQQPSEEHPAGSVLHVAQTGYQVHDRVVRPAQVVVSMSDTTTNPSAESDTLDNDDCKG